MIRAMRGVFLSLIMAGTVSAALWGRGKVVSSWSAVPIPPEGETGEWPADASYENAGMCLRAFNDEFSLTLLVSASTREGRNRLNGDARQDVELWFLRADARTRDWGMRIPYARGEGVQPELLSSSGTVVSSAAWPTELGFRMVHAGRRPIWEIVAPRSRMSPGRDGLLAFDLAFIGTGRSHEDIMRDRESSSEDGRPSRSRDRRRKSSDLDDPAAEMGPSTLKLTLLPAAPPAL